MAFVSEGTAERKWALMEIASFEDVLAFWFSEAQSSRWYANDDNFDAEIRQRFLSTYESR